MLSLLKLHAEVGVLSKLHILEVLSTRDGIANLEGHLPSELGQLTSLSYLAMKAVTISGTLPTELFGLSKLSRLRMEALATSGTLPTQIGLAVGMRAVFLNHNALSGTIPSQLARLSVADKWYLHVNQFNLPTPPEVVDTCFQGDITCFGLPPGGCSSFQNSATSWVDFDKCVDCSGGMLGPALLLTLVAALMASVVRLFCRASRVRLRLLYRYLGTASVIINHCTIISLILALDLDWPSFVDRSGAVLDLSGFSFLVSAGPECLFGNVLVVEHIGLDWAWMACAQLVLILFILLLSAAFMAILARRSRTGFDRAFRLMSVIMSMQLIPALRSVDRILAITISVTSHGMIEAGEVTERWLPVVVSLAIGVSTPVVVALLFSAAIVVVAIRDHKRAFATANFSAPTEAGKGTRKLPLWRLNTRISYFLERFGKHASFWQIVIWARQLLLLAIVSSTFDAVLPSTISGPTRVPWIRLGLALFVQIGAWVAHALVQPYMLAIDNAIESWLMAVSCVMIAVGAAYKATTEAGASEGVRLAIEVVGGVCLLGGTSTATFHAAQQWRRLQLELNSVDDFSLHEKLEESLGKGTIRLLRCSWLLDKYPESTEGEGATPLDINGDEWLKTGGGAVSTKLRRFQELPAEAFCSADEAVSLANSGSRRILVLSHCWLTSSDPDPQGIHLTALLRYLRSMGREVRGDALFWGESPQLDQLSPHAFALLPWPEL